MLYKFLRNLFGGFQGEILGFLARNGFIIIWKPYASYANLELGVILIPGITEYECNASVNTGNCWR